jgi:hypothetical protein
MFKSLSSVCLKTCNDCCDGATKCTSAALPTACERGLKFPAIATCIAPYKG